MPLEIAIFNPASAPIAQSAGASRIELCASNSQSLGGTTPSLADLQIVKSQTTIPVYVMIRPRGGDFAYLATEFERMKDELLGLRPLADGFVFGILTREHGGKVDVGRCRELIALAGVKPCTFHRAFDETGNLEGALDDVVACGFTNVLTAGGEGGAVSGAEVLGRLVRRAGGRIAVMPGGGVRAGNVGALRDRTRATWFHSSAIVGEGAVADAGEIKGMREVLERGM